MARQVFSNAIILEGEELEVTRGHLVIRDGVIERISSGAAPGRAIDMKHGFVIPPFINSHTHIVDSVAKELYLGKEQPQVVGPRGVKFKALSSHPPKEIISATRTTLLDMLSTGTLAHCDFREGGAAGVDILWRASTTPVKSVILSRPFNLRELSKVLAKSDGIGLASVDAFGPGELREIAHQTRMANKLLAVHMAETQASKKITGREVKQALGLDPSFVVHATHANADDFSLLQKKGTPVVFCSRANNILSVGVPPINLAIEAGTEFCLGTDNAMVCQPNMFEELSFAWACLRASNPTAGSDEARKLLMAATIGPMKIFDLPWGPIAEGGRATFVQLARGNNLQNLSDIYGGLVNRARADNIRAVFLDGKIVIS